MRINNIFDLKNYFYRNPRNIIKFENNKKLWETLDIFKDDSCKLLMPLNRTYNDLGNNNIILDSGTPQYSNGIDGRKCMYFDGNLRFLVHNLNILNNISFSIWVKYDFFNDGRNSIIMCQTGYRNNYLYPSPSRGISTYNKEIKYFIVGNDGNWYNKGIYYPSNNVWTHVVLSVSKNKQYFYINGSLHAQSNISTTSFYNQITIGASKNVNLFFKGCLQQIRIFNKLLTPTEVKYLYDNKI